MRSCHGATRGPTPRRRPRRSTWTRSWRPLPQPFDPAAWSASLADANVLGSRYIVHPFFGINFGTGEVTRTTAPWRAFARDLNRAGRMARDAGLKLGYHNHNWEFFRLTDNPAQTAYDVLTEVTDPDLVHLELDLFWATRGRATRSTSSTSTRAGSCSTTSRT
jgi:sugar phosphate isomerase/epimerase